MFNAFSIVDTRYRIKKKEMKELYWICYHMLITKLCNTTVSKVNSLCQEFPPTPPLVLIPVSSNSKKAPAFYCLGWYFSTCLDG